MILIEFLKNRTGVLFWALRFLFMIITDAAAIIILIVVRVRYYEKYDAYVQNRERKRRK